MLERVSGAPSRFTRAALVQRERPQPRPLKFERSRLGALAAALQPHARLRSLWGIASE